MKTSDGVHYFLVQGMMIIPHDSIKPAGLVLRELPNLSESSLAGGFREVPGLSEIPPMGGNSVFALLVNHFLSE